MKKKRYRLLYITVGILLGLWILNVAYFNLRSTSYDELNKSDQQVLNELNEYYIGDTKEPIWNGFDLEEKTILLISKSSKKVFLVNPHEEVKGVFAKKIKMLEGSKVNAYEIFKYNPEMIKFIFDGNFNTIDKTYKILGNEVYYIKYDNESSLEKQYSSQHFITFLSHEAFHYYMQGNWGKAPSGEADGLSEKDLALIDEEYKVLAEMQQMLIDKEVNNDKLLEYTKQYVDVVNERLINNREYVEAELYKETIEGTATYVGIKASDIVGYDFGVMYFDNTKNVLFSDVVPTIKSGEVEESFLFNRMPYETGALLCLVMDELKIPNWQERLNNQSENNFISVFSIIKEFVS